MVFPNPESAESRFERDWTFIEDDRKLRTLDQQSDERQSRLYVDSDTGTSATGKTSEYLEEAYSD